METIAPTQALDLPSVRRELPPVVQFTREELDLMRQLAADGFKRREIAARFGMPTEKLSQIRVRQEEVFEALEMGRLDALERGIKPGLNDTTRSGAMGRRVTCLVQMTDNERLDEAIYLYSRWGGLAHALERCRTSYSFHKKRLQTDPEYAERFEVAKMKRVENLERTAYVRGKHASDRMLSKLLDGEAPGKYGLRRHEITGADGGPIATTVTIRMENTPDTALPTIEEPQ